MVAGVNVRMCFVCKIRKVHEVLDATRCNAARRANRTKETRGVVAPFAPSSGIPPYGHVKGDNLSDADCARNIRHRPSPALAKPSWSWMATCKHGDVIASSVWSWSG